VIDLKKYEDVLIPVLKKYNINTVLRISHFLAQIDHESNSLKSLQENLNYSVQGLLATFSRTRISHADAEKYGRKPGRPANREMIANIIYGGAWGFKNLGNVSFGHGWKYRGRGPLQCTGLSNYKKYSKAVGWDFVSNPDLMLDLRHGFAFAGWYWTERNINRHADQDNVNSVTRSINGGVNGLNHRIQLTKSYKKIADTLVVKLENYGREDIS
jgi:putative chitinase